MLKRIEECQKASATSGQQSAGEAIGSRSSVLGRLNRVDEIRAQSKIWWTDQSANRQRERTRKDSHPLGPLLAMMVGVVELTGG
jgi:hypothetical protein